MVSIFVVKKIKLTNVQSKDKGNLSTLCFRYCGFPYLSPDLVVAFCCLKYLQNCSVLTVSTPFVFLFPKFKIFPICRQVSLEFCISILDMPLLIYSRVSVWFLGLAQVWSKNKSRPRPPGPLPLIRQHLKNSGGWGEVTLLFST